jgi:hypothetical protein
LKSNREGTPIFLMATSKAGFAEIIQSIQAVLLYVLGPQVNSQ